MSTVVLTSDRVDITKVGSTPGPSGNNFKVYYCYKRSSSPLVAGDQPSENYTVNFTNQSISPNPATNGWSAEIPNGKDPCYMSTAIFSGNTNEVTSTFSNPIKLVENGKDANNYTIHTTSEEIVKFKRSDSSAERLLWELSPSILQISAFDLNNLSTISNSNYTPVNNITPEQFNASKESYYYKDNNNEYIRCIPTSVFDSSITYYIKVSFFEISLLVGGYNLEDILVNLEDYLYIIKDSHGEIIDLYNYIFDITKFYNDIINDTITIDSGVDRLTVINALLNFFNNVSSQDIKISAVLHEDEEVTYNIEKFISVKNGLSEDMLKFDLNASNLNLAIQNTGLAFGAEGLTVTNGGFKIYTDNGIDGPKQVFWIDEQNKQLLMNGNGTFTGTIYAENGSFTGNINARTGQIGGFDIGAYTLSTNGLTLSADYNDNSFIATQDTSRVQEKKYFTEVDGRYYLYTLNIFDKVGEASQGQVYYLEVINLSEQNFNAQKTIFYTYNQGTYTQCTEESIFDENTTYYTVGSYTVYGYQLVQLTEEQFLANPTKYYIYDIDNDIFIRCNSESTWMQANNYYVYTIILENIGRHYDSYISVQNINIGTGAVIDDYLKIGNLKLLNPQKHDNKVMDLSSDGTSYFVLTNEGYVEGNGWSIKKEPGHPYAVARFGKLIVTDGEFSGIIHATDGVFSGEVTASTINATTLNTVNFVTEKVRAMGGSFIFKPSTNVISVAEENSQNKELRVEFNNDDNFKDYLNSYGDEPIIALSNESIHFGKLKSIQNEKYAIIEVPNQGSYNNLLYNGCYSITILGSPNQDEIIAINSDDTQAGNIIPERALVIEKFGQLQNNGTLENISINLLLGDLSTLRRIDDRLTYINGYGLYADNVFLHGSLMTATGNNSSYAGINTQKLIDFDPARWGVTGNYLNEKIIFWGGANSLSTSDIQGSNFIVTDKGSIFASKGIFKGTVISNSLITNTVIQTPVIYGSGKRPSLKIYDTNADSNVGGIQFYKKVGEVDSLDNSQPDIKTLSLSNSGFIHYQNNNDNGFKFIGFGESNKNVDMYATTFNADKTQFRSKNIEDSQTGGLIQFNNRAVRIKQNNSYIDVGEENIINNASGRVINKTAMEITNDQKTLSYRINTQGYYCLYVTDQS